MDARGLADYLRDVGVVRSPLVYKAFAAVNRKKFVPLAMQLFAYRDQALPIGHGQTISQPYTVAFMLELLDVRPGQRILDIGSGSGWTTALLAHMAGSEGEICGVERVSELVRMGQKNLAKFDSPWAKITQATDGKLGLPEKAPFDRILVSAEAAEVPEELVSQLASPGILVIPVGSAILKLSKDKNGHISQEKFEGFVFVPLIK